MVSSSTEACVQRDVDKQVNQEMEDETEEFYMNNTNKIILDANQMLLDLKNEIDNKNLQIQRNKQQLDGLKEEVAVKSESLEELKQGHKAELFEKDKLVMKSTIGNYKW